MPPTATPYPIPPLLPRIVLFPPINIKKASVMYFFFSFFFVTKVVGEGGEGSVGGLSHFFIENTFLCIWFSLHDNHQNTRRTGEMLMILV